MVTRSPLIIYPSFMVPYFFEYDKQIHTLDDATYLTNLLTKNDTLRDRAKCHLFDSNSGFYLV